MSLRSPKTEAIPLQEIASAPIGLFEMMSIYLTTRLALNRGVGNDQKWNENGGKDKLKKTPELLNKVIEESLRLVG